MEIDSYLRFILALLLVLGLLAVAAWLLRRSGYGVKLARSRRLAAIETLTLGPRHRLMLIRRDGVEHLLLLGPHNDTVVERNIQPHDLLARGAAIPAETPEADFADVLRGAKERRRHDVSENPPPRDSQSRKDQS
jgi:flagellar protein FliO/FliZ